MKKIIIAAALFIVVFVALNLVDDKPKIELAAENVPDSTIEGKIIFVRKHGSENHIHLMNANGTDVVDLVNCFNQECYPTWSPDGKKILFQRQVNGVATYVMNANGSDVKRLSPTPAFDVRPSWSPDGKNIIFNYIVKPSDTGIPETDIMVMNADGSDRRTILKGTGFFNIEPRYSPDGSKIAFMSNREGGQHVFTMNSNGTDIKKITAEGSYGDPVWSPDGSRIAFGSNRAGAVNIFIIKPDGTDIRQITFFEHPYEGGDTSWSPDGKQIVFQWDVGGKGQSDPNVKAEVRIVNSDGSGGLMTTGQSCSSVGCSPRWQFGTP